MLFQTLVLSYYKKDTNNSNNSNDSSPKTTYLEFSRAFDKILNAILLTPIIETFWK